MKVKIKLALVLLSMAVFLSIQFNHSDAKAVIAPAADIKLPPPVISSTIPSSVSIVGATSPETARPFFDYFSWQSFVALNWPAAIGADGRPVRGQPNIGQGANIGQQGIRVWESYKADWELFRPKEVPPSDWTSYELPDPGSTNPCGVVDDSKMLVMMTKMDSTLDGINQANSGPMVDQNRNYLRYEIHVNRPYYDQVVSNKWFTFKGQSQKPNIFPDGVMEIKAAWKELVKGKDDPAKFYTVNALLVEPGVKLSCRPAEMGLVGFHIANKVPGFKQWVWSTFEHVDNVPDGAADASVKYSLNNGTSTPPSVKGFDHLPDTLVDLSQPLPIITDPRREPVQVSRVTPISPAGQQTPTTDQINADWRKALVGTIWSNYRLVITQWPTDQNDGDHAGVPFPKNSVANVTMETYLQKRSCITCHFSARDEDFSFLISLRVLPPAPPLNSNLSLAQRLALIDEDRFKQSKTLQRLREELKKDQ
jgi:hypothetical protein